MKTKLTTRSKITVRWTTAPSDMGYGGNPTNWREARGETMSLRKAANFPNELGRRVGEGVYRLIEYYHNGRIVGVGEIRNVLADAEWRKMQGR